LYDLAELYRKQGKYSEAEPLYKRSIGIYENKRGPNSGTVATCLESYAGLLRETNRKAEADELDVRAKAIRVKSHEQHQL
jgi:tetratricopeptide (TPR) repeat protein